VKRKRVEVNLEELDRVLDHAREAPLSEPDYDKLKQATHDGEDQHGAGATRNATGEDYG
jgi:hypothetical protein